ncbi:MAG: hypothetical protein WAL31_04855 [Gaiellaceae bacterium]
MDPLLAEAEIKVSLATPAVVVVPVTLLGSEPTFVPDPQPAAAMPTRANSSSASGFIHPLYAADSLDVTADPGSGVIPEHRPKPELDQSAEQASLRLVSAKTLPWINGTCVFVFQTAEPAAGSAAVADVLQRILTIGHPRNVRPWFFELDAKGSNSGLTNAGWMPDGDGVTAAKPGLTYPLAHG